MVKKISVTSYIEAKNKIMKVARETNVSEEEIDAVLLDVIKDLPKKGYDIREVEEYLECLN